MPMSEYVRRLRARLGHELIMLEAVTIIIFDEVGRVLLALDRSSGLWMTVGGALEPDETPADAAVRECWEETGLLVRANKLLGVLGGPTYRITYGNGDVVSYTITVFEAEIIAGTAQPDGEEAAALRFVSQAEVADLPMAEWTRELVSLAFDRRDEPYFAPATWRPSVLP
jgi:8-oxo-dGTP pyrophosphatase MutT (NUDIX family)